MAHPHSIPAAAARDQLAELLSLNLTVAEAARRMGIPRKRANIYLARIRQDLGAQAV